REVHARDRLVDLRQPSLVPRQQLRLPLVLSPFLVENHTARHAHRKRTTLRRQRPAPRPVSVAAPLVPALVPERTQCRRQFLLHELLDGFTHAVVNQYAERDRLFVTQPQQLPGTFSHGAFLRWPSGKTARWLLTNRKNAPSLFSTRIGTRPR